MGPFFREAGDVCMLSFPVMDVQEVPTNKMTVQHIMSHDQLLQKVTTII